MNLKIAAALIDRFFMDRMDTLRRKNGPNSRTGRPPFRVSANISHSNFHLFFTRQGAGQSCNLIKETLYRSYVITLRSKFHLRFTGDRYDLWRLFNLI